MNVMDLVAKLTLDNVEYLKGLGDSEKEAKGFASRAKSGLKTLSKVGVAAVGAAASAAGVLLKTSVSNYAEYEQMLGGVRKLYGNMGLSVEDYAKKMNKSVSDVKGDWQKLEQAQNLVLENANKAYLSSGMSANEYMSMATTFSASLIQSLKGDTIEAAKQTDVAMRAISDNFNTFGGDIGMIQGAFAGFAKGNFAMLDNLKLGYQGTRSEMERLIADANEWAKANGMAADLSIDSFSDIVTAIDYIQRKQNIWGTTANEAATTIAGSIMMTKAAWQNLVTGFSDPDSDIGLLVSNVMTSAGTAVSNLIPAVSKAIEGMGSAINTMLPEVVKGIPNFITSIVIPLITQGFTTIKGVLQGLIQTIPTLISQLFPQILSGMTQLASTISEQFPAMLQGALTNLVGISEVIRGMAGMFVDSGLNIVKSIADGIIQNIPTIIQTVPTIISNFAGIINDNAPKILATGVQIILGLAKGIISAIPTLIANFPKIVTAIWDVFTAVNWLALGGQVLTAIGNGIKALGESIPSTLKSIGSKALEAFKGISWSSVGSTVVNLIGSGIRALINLPFTLLRKAASSAMKAFTGIAWGNVGSNIIQGIARGITAGVSTIVNAARNAAKKALSAAKKFLGIESPSKVFRDQVGKNISLGMALGIEKATPQVEKAMDGLNSTLLNDIAVPTATLEVDTSTPYAQPNEDSESGAARSTVFNYEFNVYGTSNQSPKELAEVIRQMIIQEERRRKVAWA